MSKVKVGTTKSANEQTVKRDWYEIDATGLVLGRLATFVASRLRGKHKPEFTTHVDTGDYIIVKNASKIKLTGNKVQDKKYYSHSAHTGSLKEITYEKLLAKDATLPLKKAVKGMLVRGPLGYAILDKLKIYAGDEHPHEAQQPKILTLAGVVEEAAVAAAA
jgi:large subunit ribosomal protein L13